MKDEGWVGVDLDGTLAFYDSWRGEDHIGQPIPLMQARVREWLDAGLNVRIVTARVANGPHQVALIKGWCLVHLGRELEVTNVKDFGMVALYDDRAVAIEPNTGIVQGGRDHAGLLMTLLRKRAP